MCRPPIWRAEIHLRSFRSSYASSPGRRASVVIRRCLDFRSLPAEFMLVPNLENSAYVELVLGDLDQLEHKMALAGRTAGSWTQWRRLHHPLHTGRLPRRLLRKENLIENLITLYDDQCQKEAADVERIVIGRPTAWRPTSWRAATWERVRGISVPSSRRSSRVRPLRNSSRKITRSPNPRAVRNPMRSARAFRTLSTLR